MHIKYTAYESITLRDWTLSTLTFSSSNAFQLVNYDAAAVTEDLTITGITVNKDSVLRDATVFDIKGSVNKDLNFDFLTLD